MLNSEYKIRLTLELDRAKSDLAAIESMPRVIIKRKGLENKYLQLQKAVEILETKVGIIALRNQGEEAEIFGESKEVPLEVEEVGELGEAKIEKKSYKPLIIGGGILAILGVGLILYRKFKK